MLIHDFDSPWMRPSCAFMDPTHTFTVPKKQTAAGTVDIMSHVLEAYFSRAQGFMQDIVDFANAAGALCATQTGSMMSMPYENEINECRKTVQKLKGKRK